MKTNFITKIIGLAGLKACASACGVAYQQVRRWEIQGHLPRTDFTGETEYAASLSSLVGGDVTADDLRSMRPAKKKAA